MFTHLAEDWRSYRHPVLAQGFWALQIHRFGARVRKLRWAVFRIPLKGVHILFVKLSEIFFGIYIGVNAKIGRRFIIEHFGGVIIHSDAVIGDDVRVQQGVTIGNKGPSTPRDVPVIGNRVFIGAGAKVLGKIVISDDVAIGANAVVITDVPPNSTAVGVPARILRKQAKERPPEEKSEDGTAKYSPPVVVLRSETPANLKSN
jgi:serine O-acetyltransferase